MWPVVRACGRFWGVVILAATMALLTMICQWWWTDVRRLREVKRRAAALRKEAYGLKEGTPRDVALLAMAAKADWRVARAAFVPLGVLLGPMMVAFLWFPERVDMAAVNAPPGGRVMVTAVVDGERDAALSLVVLPPLVLEEGASDGKEGDHGVAAQKIESGRGSLVALEKDFARAEGGGEMPASIKARVSASDKSLKELHAELVELLAGKLPEQNVSWTVKTSSSDAGAVNKAWLEVDGRREEILVATGEAAPPLLGATNEGAARVVRWVPGALDGTVVHEIKVSFLDERRAEEKIFWRPFAWMGWHWDVGWLGVYMVAYLPAMMVMKRVLRVP